MGLSVLGGFVWDDRPLIVDNRLIKDPGSIGTILTSGFWQAGDRHDRFRSFFRPVTSLSYALDYGLWGLRPAGFHATNLLLHVLCCWLVFRLALKEGVGRGTALFAALLFAAHPVHVESVAWISGRTDLLATLFVLLAFGLERGRDACAPSRRAVMRGAALACFVLGLLSKEVAAVLPLLVFGRTLAEAPAASWRARLGAATRASGTYVLVFGLYLLGRTLALGAGAEPLYRLDASSYLSTALFTLARYLTLLLLPVGLDAHYPYPPLGGLASGSVALAAAMLAAVVFAARRLSPANLFWLGWFFAALLPVLTFGSFGDVLMADRFLYLPSAGAAILLARLLPSTPPAAMPVTLRRWRIAVLPGCVLALLGLVSAARARVWRDDTTLFSTMARTSSRSAMVRCNLGLAYYDAGEYPSAKAEFREALRLVPGYALAHNNLAAALERDGDLEGAAAAYRAALRIAPLQIESHVNLGSVLVRLGRTSEGMELLRATVVDHPRYPPALYALAEALDRTGDGGQAMPYLDRAIAADPFYPNARYLKGKLLLEGGDLESAAEEMRRFLSVWEPDGPYRQVALEIVARAAKDRAVERHRAAPVMPASSVPPPR